MHSSHGQPFVRFPGSGYWCIYPAHSTYRRDAKAKIPRFDTGTSHCAMYTLANLYLKENIRS